MTAGRGILHAVVALDRGGRVRVIAGQALGVRGPVELRETQLLLTTLALRRGDDVELAIEREHTAFVVVSEGEAEIARQRVGEDHLALLSRGDRVRLRAPERDATLLLVAGRPLRGRLALLQDS